MAPPIDFSAMIQAAAEAAPRGPRFQPLPAGAFSAASLTSWLDVARAAGVPHVPAEVVGVLDLDAVLAMDTPEAPGVEEASAELDRINASLAPGTMLRWDCCAGLDVKMGMSSGQAPGMEERKLHPMEPRTFDILYEFPSDQVAVVRRPWVEIAQIDGFPVEFRVFAEEGKIVAAANYYLQRNLPDTPAIRQAAAQAVELAGRMLDTLADQARFPAMPGQPDPNVVAATLDFLLTPSGEVLFLEAGPGHHFGAHPCSFLRPDGAVDPLDGMSLGSGRPGIALADLDGLDPSTRRAARL